MDAEGGGGVGRRLRQARPSLRRRHHELRSLRRALGPALHDRLLLGVEAHALFAVGMHVAEQAALPAAEAVPGHRHRDRHVDPTMPTWMRRANSRATLPSLV